jgi:tRNA(Ile)-lysidine synthase
MDDQAETVLLALLRGGGLESLAAMDPVNPPVVRPLLTTTREETEAFCRALRLRPRRDPMNEDPRYMRVAVRREVIPLLEERLGRNVRTTLVRTAAVLRRDADYLDRLAEEAAREILEPAGGGSSVERSLRLGPLRKAPAPIAARVVRRALLDLGVVPEAAHVAAVLDLAAARPRTTVSLPQELIARREREYVRFLRPSPRGQASAKAPPWDRRRPRGS